MSETDLGDKNSIEGLIKVNLNHLDTFIDKEKLFVEKVVPFERPMENQTRFGGDGIIRNEPYLKLRKLSICYDFFKLFFNSKRVVIYNLIKNFRYFHNERNILMQNIIHRSLIERLAYFYYMIKQIKNHQIEDYSPSEDDSPTDLKISNLETILHRGLQQSRIELVGLEKINIKSDVIKEYQPKEGAIDKTSLNILTPINQLNKKFEGVTNTYNFLSEFLHPNSGDLMSATVKVEDTRNDFDDLYRKRYVGFGKTTYRDPSSGVLFQCWEQLVDIIVDYASHLEELDSYENKLRKYLSNRTHFFLKKYGLKTFNARKGNKCPCGSGLRIKDCARL